MNKKKMKAVIIYSILIVLLCVGIWYVIQNHINTSKKSENVSYEEFGATFNKFRDEMVFEGFEIVPESLGTSVIYIDKELSFETREFMTIDDTYSVDTTQKSLEYYNEQEKIVLTVDFIYLPEAVGKDMVYWYNPSNASVNDIIRNTYAENMLSYKNVLIKIGMIAIADKNADDRKLAETTKQVVEFINANLK